MELNGKSGWVYKALKTLVWSGWDFVSTSEKLGVNPEQLVSLVNDQNTLKNAFFGLGDKGRKEFKTLWEYTQFDGYVYFILSEDSARVKIGYSSDPFERIKRLQTGNPETLFLAQYIQGNTKVEKLLHERFSQYHIRGEWFELSGAVSDYINAIPRVSL